MRILVLAVAVAAVALSGCAMTPKELQTEGKRFDYTSARAPKDAAHCVARNSEEYKPGLGSGGFPANVREAATAGAWEVVVPHPGAQGTLAFALVAPAAAGSKLTIWQYPHMILWADELADVLAKGC